MTTPESPDDKKPFNYSELEAALLLGAWQPSSGHLESDQEKDERNSLSLSLRETGQRTYISNGTRPKDQPVRSEETLVERHRRYGREADGSYQEARGRYLAPPAPLTHSISRKTGNRAVNGSCQPPSNQTSSLKRRRESDLGRPTSSPSKTGTFNANAAGTKPALSSSSRPAKRMRTNAQDPRASSSTSTFLSSPSLPKDDKKKNVRPESDFVTDQLYQNEYPMRHKSETTIVGAVFVQETGLSPPEGALRREVRKGKMQPYECCMELEEA
ncbi:hypothetical protein CVT26_012047 [Gymnopilus dilepis]|uniref:Uncharacterized protein n=1 Tax=Gymnopilus dilepis TaxID=231916 RepID=A0A409VYE2_9AGAR|nr:hypothetical protein CVT26_012047 [Gymnopilus dilepis]